MHVSGPGLDKVQACPVCQNQRARPLLKLKHSPIYLHPVPETAEVPKPHTVDLDYRQCLSCGHAYQASYDMAVLTGIYRNHYYTPAAEGVSMGARADFMAYVAQNFRRWGGAPKRVLEVGCSSGEVLDEVRGLFGLSADGVQGVEPNLETAAAARQRGLLVHEVFLEAAFVAKLGRFDLVYSRHVIEHVDALEPFLQGLRQASGEQGLVILETPSLDACLRVPAVRGLHVEHLHMFSLRSLIEAAARVGLIAIDWTETALGNLIVVFRAQGRVSRMPTVDTSTDLQSIYDRHCDWWRQRLSQRPAVFWGAGSAARLLIADSGCEPVAIGDANPGKTGKRFVGLPYWIVYAPDYIAGLVASGRDQEYVLVAASMFHAEIRQAAERLGWRGDFVAFLDDRPVR